MWRVFSFLLKTTALVAIVVFVAQSQGKVEVAFRGYLIETSVGFVAALFFSALLLWTLFYRLVLAFVPVPAVFRRYRAALLREEGYKAVTQGLVAIAAGDGRLAEKHALRAKAMIPEAPLTRLLGAQTALMTGDAVGARRLFAALLEDKEAAFFGLRGLLAESLAAQNYAVALTHIRRAEKLQPKRPWIIRALFDLETRNRDWDKAQKTLARAERLGFFDAVRAKRHRQALLMAQSDEAFARGDTKGALRQAAASFAVGAGFIPAAARLAKYYLDTGRRRRAIKTAMKAWQENPHPDIADLWRKLQPPAKKAVSVYDEGRDIYDWALPLYGLHKDHRESHRLLGLAAQEARMWREARDHLMQAQDFRALARLARAETGNEAQAREWLEAASDSPPDPKWICQDCGHATLDWSALCRHCGVFDRFEWMTPSLDVRESSPPLAAANGDLFMPPAHYAVERG